MRLISFSFKDLDNKWTLEKIEFKELSLLVGVSGVGKTKILNSLATIHSFALGKDLTNAEWELVFEIEGLEYTWAGSYKRKDKGIDDLLNTTSKFVSNLDDANLRVAQSELLERKIGEKTEIIFKRTNDIIQFKDQFNLPKLSGEKSCLELFSNEKDITLIVAHFSKIFFFDFENERRIQVPNVSTIEVDELEVITHAKIPTIMKLALVYESFPEVFEDIKYEYMSIFPTVTDIRFKKQINKKSTNDKNNYLMELEIEESRDSWHTWVNKGDISSGMLKTLLYVSLFYLSPRGSVIINDEFENSLGLNCIDIIKEAMAFGPQKQIISTSHHPYIINNIKMDNWIIVSRRGNKVSCGTSEEYKLGNSKHEAFKQLMNSDKYRKGAEF